MSRPRIRARIEDAATLDIAEMRRCGMLLAGQHSRPWRFAISGREVIGTVQVEISRDRGAVTATVPQLPGILRPVRNAIALESRQQRFGGRFWYFRCPVSRLSARRLFLFAGQPSFQCRASMHPQPTYASQRRSGRNRALDYLHEFQRDYGLARLYDRPIKPPGSWTRTFARKFYARELMVFAELAKLVGSLGRRTR